ncbi:AMP-binding protein, partial [Streptomyces sp. SID10244]|nr:AMP-binding protein [Streptomyces sp. SID10244]
HEMLELHNAVPGLGAVLVPLNIRLSEVELSYIVEHSGASLLVATVEFAEAARAVGATAGVRVLVSGDADDEYRTLLDGAPEPVWRN